MVGFLLTTVAAAAFAAAPKPTSARTATSLDIAVHPGRELQGLFSWKGGHSESWGKKHHSGKNKHGGNNKHGGKKGGGSPSPVTPPSVPPPDCCGEGFFCCGTACNPVGSETFAACGEPLCDTPAGDCQTGAQLAAVPLSTTLVAVCWAA